MSTTEPVQPISDENLACDDINMLATHHMAEFCPGWLVDGVYFVRLGGGVFRLDLARGDMRCSRYITKSTWDAAISHTGLVQAELAAVKRLADRHDNYKSYGELVRESRRMMGQRP